MRYIKSYNNTTDLRTDLAAGELGHPYVAKVNNTIDFNSITTNWENEYFTIIALTDGTISYSHKEGSNPMFYSINEGEWIETTVSVDISVSKNDMIRFKSNRGNQAYNQETFTSGGTAQFEVAGNLMSLVAGDDFATYVPNTNATGTDGELYCSFKNFFKDCTGLISAKNLIIKYCDNESFSNFFNGCYNLQMPPKLPAMTLANNCYSNMFNGCQMLLTAPELPATTLADGCYSYMFYGCSNLASAPALPATTLVDNCYQSMFGGCMSFITAPKLPATTLAKSCYEYMFRDCTNLASAPALPAMTLAQDCYSMMFYDCTNLTTAPELPAMTLANNCYNNMFSSCISLTQAPELPATTLAQGCYSQMFWKCISLTQAPELPATDLAPYCYNSMFYGTNVLPDCSNIDFASSTVVASGGLSGLFAGTKVTDNELERLLPKNDNGKYYLPVTTLGDNCYSSMFQGCTSLTTAPALPATTLKFRCYGSMFAGCTSLITAPELPATTLENMCYSGMFQDCTSLTTAPALPATTLKPMCYSHIFNNCTSLNYIKCLATDISTFYCTYSWVSGVASTGTFVKNPNMTSWAEGKDGIPSGWSVLDNNS